MPLQVSSDAFAVEIRSELTTQHVEDPGTFRVGSIVELFLRAFESPPDDRFLIGVLDNVQRVEVEPEPHLIRSELMLIVEMGVVGGEAFVQPEMGPVLTGD